MFENIPLIYMSIRILKFWSLIYDHNWRRYLCLSLTIFLVFTQFMYMFQTTEGMDAIICSSYMLVLWFNTILRASILVYNRKQFEGLIADLECFYYDLKMWNEPYIQTLLTDMNAIGKMMARGNLFLGLLTCIGFGCYPLFVPERVLPFGSIIPGVDAYKSPFYEFWYAYQMIITPMGCCMYIPFTSLIVAFIMFGIVMCKALQYRLRTLKDETDVELFTGSRINECIKYQMCIIKYISVVNSLTTYIFLLEFIAFSALLCALLFLLIIVTSIAQAIIVCAYIAMILAQILALYWYANELRNENLEIATAAYDTNWSSFPLPVQKQVILILLRSQKPCSIMVGNMQPMSMELFQALLNASYSYFTLLKRVYG